MADYIRIGTEVELSLFDEYLNTKGIRWRGGEAPRGWSGFKTDRTFCIEANRSSSCRMSSTGSMACQVSLAQFFLQKGWPSPLSTREEVYRHQLGGRGDAPRGRSDLTMHTYESHWEAKAVRDLSRWHDTWAHPTMTDIRRTYVSPISTPVEEPTATEVLQSLGKGKAKPKQSYKKTAVSKMKVEVL